MNRIADVVDTIDDMRQRFVEAIVNQVGNVAGIEPTQQLAQFTVGFIRTRADFGFGDRRQRSFACSQAVMHRTREQIVEN